MIVIVRAVRDRFSEDPADDRLVALVLLPQVSQIFPAAYEVQFIGTRMCMILVRKPPGLFFEKSKNHGFKRRVTVRHSSCQGQFYPFSELGLSFDEIKQVHMDYPVSVLQQIICRHHIFGVVVPDQLKRSVFAILCFLA